MHDVRHNVDDYAGNIPLTADFMLIFRDIQAMAYHDQSYHGIALYLSSYFFGSLYGSSYSAVTLWFSGVNVSDFSDHAPGSRNIHSPCGGTKMW